MPDCVRNGLGGGGRVAQVGGEQCDGDIRGICQVFCDLPEHSLVAGDEAKMHTLSGKFGCDGGTDAAAGTRYQCNLPR